MQHRNMDMTPWAHRDTATCTNKSTFKRQTTVRGLQTHTCQHWSTERTHACCPSSSSAMTWLILLLSRGEGSARCRTAPCDGILTLSPAVPGLDCSKSTHPALCRSLASLSCPFPSTFPLDHPLPILSQIHPVIWSTLSNVQYKFGVLKALGVCTSAFGSIFTSRSQNSLSRKKMRSPRATTLVSFHSPWLPRHTI